MGLSLSGWRVFLIIITAVNTIFYFIGGLWINLIAALAGFAALIHNILADRRIKRIKQEMEETADHLSGFH